MIEYIKGDILKSGCKLIVHGCNAQGVMGSGLAKQIKEKYPKAYEDYVEMCREMPEESLLGSVNFSEQDDGTVIANAITQLNFGKDGRRYVSYDAIDECFEDIALYCEVNDIMEIAIPRIGAGLGGGNWEIIESIIKQNFLGTSKYSFGTASNVNIKVYEL